jgi:beta-glucuronidase
MPYERVDLCGLWRFQPDPANEGAKAAYFDPQYDCTLWREALLPASFEACCPGLDAYEGAGWFRRTLAVPADWRGRRIVLRFRGVNYHARVWVNGQDVGQNRDGFLPFAFPIQDVLRFNAEHVAGGENVIVVRADNVRLKGEVPGLQRGWRTFGGILREVALLVTDLLYLDAVTVVAEPVDGGGSLAIRAHARNERAQIVEAVLSVRVSNGQGETLATFTSQPATLEPGEERVFSLRGRVEGVEPWSPASPNLYTAQVTLSLPDCPVDDATIRFGFRKVQVGDGKLCLNGEPIYLTGFNRHEDSPYRDMATDLATTRQDLIDMKEAGANFVRLCHYPHHPAELDLCDELGLLVMGEIPLYWWDGYREGQDHCADKLEAAKRQLSVMIRRDINHPSVVFWSVSNENHEELPEVVAGNQELLCLARRLDPTRLAVHVSDHWQQYPHFEQDDVICVNAYPSLDKRGYEGQYAYDFSESTRFWREGLEALHARYPHKPILISEFGYASLEGVYGSAFGEEAQARAIACEFAGMDAPYVCGATIWCWADHAWPPATFEFCRYLGISPYGVVTRERRKLKAYWTIVRLFRQKQGIVERAQGAVPVVGPSGHTVIMVRPDLRDIPQVPFPGGFGIRPMRLDEIGLWTDIERDAEPYFWVADDLFCREFGHDLQAVQWRCFIMTDRKGVGVGTISAWYNRDFKGQDYGRIHWLAVRQAYQRKGVGRAGLSFALNQLARWHERCYLITHTGRLPALKLYLDFGFVPDLDPPGAVEAWREVKGRLSHPALENLP